MKLWTSDRIKKLLRQTMHGLRLRQMGLEKSSQPAERMLRFFQTHLPRLGSCLVCLATLFYSIRSPKKIAGFAAFFISFSSFAADSVKLALNWKPEPEFGGFYDAQVTGKYEKIGLKVEILPGGAGQPVVQMVAAGKVEYGIASADEVVIARSHGADVVAVYAVYQTNPMAIMAHASKGFKSIQDVFHSDVTLAIEKGLPFAQFLFKKFGGEKLKVVPYAGGVANFLHDANFAQQGFATSEPLLAKKQGSDPQTFLIAESGYNPYPAVIVVRGDYLRKNHEQVKKMVSSSREGWAAYLKDPSKANAKMHELNSTMDAETFAACAEAQKPLIENPTTRKMGLGYMDVARWKGLITQMKDLKSLDKEAPKAESCFSKI